MLSSPSPYRGGVAVVEYHLRARCKRHLTQEQAQALWVEIKDRLTTVGLAETVEEAEESTTGRLDTLPRGDVLDAVATVLCGHAWPCNMDSEAVFDAFVRSMTSAMNARGYLRVDQVEVLA